MGLLTMNAEQLRYKMKNLDALCPNRSVCNDEQLYDLYSKLRDLIEFTDYKIDIVIYTLCYIVQWKILKCMSKDETLVRAMDSNIWKLNIFIS